MKTAYRGLQMCTNIVRLGGEVGRWLLESHQDDIGGKRRPGDSSSPCVKGKQCD